MVINSKQICGIKEDRQCVVKIQHKEFNEIKGLRHLIVFSEKST